MPLQFHPMQNHGHFMLKQDDVKTRVQAPTLRNLLHGAMRILQMKMKSK
jgi:hypothetical protein